MRNLMVLAYSLIEHPGDSRSLSPADAMAHRKSTSPPANSTYSKRLILPRESNADPFFLTNFNIYQSLTI
jgi:hypothetical protein